MPCLSVDDDMIAMIHECVYVLRLQFYYYIERSF